MAAEITDRRFVGFCDVPPDGLKCKGPAMGRDGYDLWENGKSIFSPEFRWALVRREENEK